MSDAALMLGCSSRVLRHLSIFAAVFALGLVVFGSFVRLSNAGLSCPDWPTCYGQVTWPKQTKAVARANAAYPDRPYERHKAWREQVHRLLAGLLGMTVLALALLSAWQQRWARLTVIGAALVAILGIILYVHGVRTWSLGLGCLAIVLPLWVAMRLERPGAWRISVLVLGSDHVSGVTWYVDSDVTTEANRGVGTPARWHADRGTTCLGCTASCWGCCQ